MSPVVLAAAILAVAVLVAALVMAALVLMVAAILTTVVVSIAVVMAVVIFVAVRSISWPNLVLRKRSRSSSPLRSGLPSYPEDDDPRMVIIARR